MTKWSSIKHKKGAADAKRGKLFSKLSRAIMVATKEGGADPASNLALQNAIEKARSYSMPKDNIERAVAKGSGEAGSASRRSSTRAPGPKGSPSSSRRSPTIATAPRRRCGACSPSTAATSAPPARWRWQFERLGVVLVLAEGVDEETLRRCRSGCGRNVELDGPVSLISAPRPRRRAASARGAPAFAIESAESMVPKTTVAISDESVAEQAGRPTGRGSRRVGRRPGRVRELRHPGGGARGRHLFMISDLSGSTRHRLGCCKRFASRVLGRPDICEYRGSLRPSAARFSLAQAAPDSPERPLARMRPITELP